MIDDYSVISHWISSNVLSIVFGALNEGYSL